MKEKYDYKVQKKIYFKLPRMKPEQLYANSTKIVEYMINY